MLKTTLKLARPRTWIFVVLSYIIGWSGISLSFDFFAGMIAFIMLVVNVNLLNAYTDVEEDSKNLPFRVNLVEQIGQRNLLRLCALLYLIAIAIAILLSILFFLVFIVAMLDTIFYSVKPLRLKANPVLSLLAFSGAVFFPSLGGLVLNGYLQQKLILIFLLSYFFLVYGTIKNIPDFEGDKKAGLKTTATIFDTRKKAIQFAMVLLLSPYFLLSILLITNALNSIFSVLLLFLPWVCLLCYKLIGAEEFDKLEKLHTYGFFYQTGILLTSLLLIDPSVLTIVLSVATLIILITIQFLRLDSR